MDVRSLALDIVPDVLRREDGFGLPAGHAGPQLQRARLPFRLFLDETIRMVSRLYTSGDTHLNRSI